MFFNVGGAVLKTKTFIENTYEQMRSANIVKNSEHFSTEYLGKSKSYFRAMKSQQLDANTEMLAQLANNLNARRKLFESVGTGDMSWYYEDWQKIEKNIAEELALRATARGCINTHALKSVLSTLQRLLAQRNYATA